jgi:hypothetical protein
MDYWRYRIISHRFQVCSGLLPFGNSLFLYRKWPKEFVEDRVEAQIKKKAIA